MLTIPNQQSSADKEVLKQLGSHWQLKKKLMDWLDQNDWIEYKFNERCYSVHWPNHNTYKIP